MADVRIISSGNWAIGAGVTNYLPAASTSLIETSATRTQAESVWNVGGTFKNLFINVNTNGVNGSTFSTVKGNSTAGNLTISITASTTGIFEDTSHSDTVTAGDTWQLKFVRGATGVTDVFVTNITFSATTNTVSKHSSGVITSFTTASATRYLFLAGRNATIESTEVNTQGKVETAGTLQNMEVLIRTNARTTTTTFRDRIATANGTLVVSVGSTATGNFSDTSHTDSVTVGQLVNYTFATLTTSLSIVIDNVSCEYSTTDGSYFTTGGTGGGIGFPAASTNYIAIGGEPNVTATETFAQSDFKTSLKLSFLGFNVQSNTTTAATTINLRKASTNLTQTISYASGATGYVEDTSDSDNVGSGDLIDIKVAAGATGTSFGVWNTMLLVQPQSSNLSISVHETLTTTESVVMNNDRTLSVFNTLTTTESVKVDNQYNISVHETLTTTESVQPGVLYNVSVYDTLTTTESVVVQSLGLPVSVFDTLTTTETVQFIAPIAVGLIADDSRLIVRDSLGNFYFVIASSTGAIQMYMNSGSGWTLQDSADQPSGTTGTSVSLAIDSTDTLHILYGLAGSIKHVTFSSGSWGTPETAIAAVSGSGQTSVAIAVDSNDIPHAVVASPTISSNRLSYSNKIGGSWNTTVAVTTVSNGASGVSMLIDNNNIPQISFQTLITITQGLKACIGNANNATSFTTTTVDSPAGGGANSTSIALDSNNNTWIGYVDASSFLSIVEHLSTDPWSTWQTPIQDPGSVLIKSVTTAVNATNIYVIFEDSLATGIYYDMYNGSSWLGKTLLIDDTHGYSYHRPVSKWSQYDNNFGSNQIDFIFDDGANIYYGNILLQVSQPININETPNNLIAKLILY